MGRSSLCCIVLFAIELLGAVRSCRDGLTPYLNSCYFFSHDLENWMNAEDMCKVLFGGGLAEVDSESESNFINSQVFSRLKITDRYWIGATDVVNEGVWEWTSSQANVRGPSYVDFRESNSQGNENCLEVMSAGIWNDVACSASRHYICEIESGPTEIVG